MNLFKLVITVLRGNALTFRNMVLNAKASLFSDGGARFQIQKPTSFLKPMTTAHITTKGAPKGKQSNGKPTSKGASPSNNAETTRGEKKHSKSSGKQETRTCFMFPNLHPAILSAVSSTLTDPPAFQPKDSEKNLKDDRESNVVAQFSCQNSKCKNSGWDSGHVAIVIRLYNDNTYNAVVYNQRCRKCNKLGTMELDEETYIERVAYRLQKWGGVSMNPPPYTGGDDEKPHRDDLCEGCKLGHCKQGMKLGMF